MAKPSAEPTTASRFGPMLNVAGPLLFLVLAFVVYFPAIHGQFLWDDNVMLTENVHVRAADGLRSIWLSNKQPDYLPLTSTSFWLEWRLWGMNPTGYHVTNILLHALNGLLLWRVLRRLRIPCPWLTAIVFVVHPVCVASVAWIAERKNTLSLCLYLVSMLLFFRSDSVNAANEDSSEPKSGRAYWSSVLTFALALLAKASGVAMPMFLLLAGWWQRGSITWRDVRRVLPFFGLSLAFAIVTIWFQYERAGAAVVAEPLNWSAKLVGASWAVWFYAWKAFWPVQLSMMYPLWDINLASILAWVPAIALAALCVAAWRRRGTWGQPVVFGIGYVLLMLLPVLGFARMSFFMYSRVADHWQYLALIGFIAAGVAIGHRLMQAAPSSIRIATAAALAVCLSFLTWKHAAVFASPETLWRDTLANNPKAWSAWASLGSALADQGRHQEAIDCFEKSLHLKAAAPETHYNLANSLSNVGRVADAIEHFSTAIRLRPRYAEAHYNLGMAFERNHQVDAAVAQYELAIQARPNHANAHNNLGNLLGQLGRYDDAARHYRAALKLKPELVEAQNNLANVLSLAEKFDEAVGHYQQALKLKPDYADAHGNLAFALDKLGRFEEAQQHWREAVRLNPRFTQAYFNWANALMAHDSYAEAAANYTATLRLQPNFPQAHYNLAMVFLHDGKRAQAKRELTEALRLKPDFAEAQQQIEKLSRD